MHFVPLEVSSTCDGCVPDTDKVNCMRGASPSYHGRLVLLPLASRFLLSFAKCHGCDRAVSCLFPHPFVRLSVATRKETAPNNHYDSGSASVSHFLKQGTPLLWWPLTGHYIPTAGVILEFARRTNPSGRDLARVFSVREAVFL